MNYHILNGDALRLQFPSELLGTAFVMRECMVDGPVAGATLPALYETRADYLHQTYAAHDIPSYATEVIPEFEQILAIPAGSTVTLWFEDDLFCQVNLYFTLYLLTQGQGAYQLTLVRPNGSMQYGFGGMSQEALVNAYHHRDFISAADWKALAGLWPLYQAGDYVGMRHIAHQYTTSYPFLVPAIEAEISRHPQDGTEGKPLAVIREIIDRLQTDKLGPVFQTFSKEHPIYGFGDLQVEALITQVR